MALETNLVFIKNTASSPTLTFGFGLNGICQLNLKRRQSLISGAPYHNSGHFTQRAGLAPTVSTENKH